MVEEEAGVDQQPSGSGEIVIAEKKYLSREDIDEAKEEKKHKEKKRKKDRKRPEKKEEVYRAPKEGPAGTKEDPTYVRVAGFEEEALQELSQKLSEELGLSEERMQSIVNDMARVAETLDEVEGLIRSLGDDAGNFVKDVKKGFRDVGEQVDAFSRQMSQDLNKVEQALAAEGGEVQSDMRAVIASLARAQHEQNEILEGQTPEPLRIPTPARIAQEVFSENELERRNLIDLVPIQKDDGTVIYRRELTRDRSKLDAELYGDKDYQSAVEDWFEDKLRLMETSEQSFEEQAEVYNRVVAAEVFFRYKRETKPLADKIQKRMEARRLKKRVVRTWGLVPPSSPNLMSVASSFHKEHLQHLFTYETTDERGRKINPVADEFIKYEKMGMKLDDLRREKEQLEKSGARDRVIEEKKKEIKKLENKIKNYFDRGGTTEGLGYGIQDAQGRRIDYVDDAIVALEEKQARGELSTVQKSALKKLKDTIWARRSAGELWSITFKAAQHDVLLNGTGDFFAARDMNFADRIDKPGYEKARAYFDSSEHGKLDLWLRDYFSNAISDNDYRDEKGTIDITQYDLTSERFWNEIISQNKQQYSADQIDKFINADETRKFFWGQNGFLQNPSLKRFEDLRGLGKHISDKENIGEDAKFDDPSANKRQEWFAEQLDRWLDWSKTEECAELVENLKIFPSAERKWWIERASVHEMVTNKQRDKFFAENVSLPVPFVSARRKAELRARMSMIYAPMRDPVMRSMLITGNISEFIKRLLNYVFSDDIR